MSDVQAVRRSLGAESFYAEVIHWVPVFVKLCDAHYELNFDIKRRMFKECFWICLIAALLWCSLIGIPNWELPKLVLICFTPCFLAVIIIGYAIVFQVAFQCFEGRKAAILNKQLYLSDVNCGEIIEVLRVSASGLENDNYGGGEGSSRLFIKVKNADSSTKYVPLLIAGSGMLDRFGKEIAKAIDCPFVKQKGLQHIPSNFLKPPKPLW